MAVKVAIVGVGNCAKSLVEGVSFYSRNRDERTGLMNPFIGKRHASDIRFVAAFDIDKRKVDRKLHEAISAEPNRTVKIADVPESEVIVQRGPTHDSIIPELRAYFIHESDKPAVDVTKALKDAKAEVVVSYLPTGSVVATYEYANAALQASCSFINCMPTPIAKDPEWRRKFEGAGLALMGDDVKSQCGATIVNRALLDLLKMRGVRVTASEQVNYGGNADHFNLHFRPGDKEASKESALNSVLDRDDAKPSARMIYTEANYDHKQAKIKIEGKTFGLIPVSISLMLEDEDSPNSGGVVIDAVRAAKLLVETKRPHLAKTLCAFLFKAPPEQYSDADALQRFRDIIGSLTRA